MIEGPKKIYIQQAQRYMYVCPECNQILGYKIRKCECGWEVSKEQNKK